MTGARGHLAVRHVMEVDDLEQGLVRMELIVKEAILI